ncbi:hypothetical protein L9F63_014691, partial [Diploptera punctata]
WCMHSARRIKERKAVWSTTSALNSNMSPKRQVSAVVLNLSHGQHYVKTSIENINKFEDDGTDLGSYIRWLGSFLCAHSKSRNCFRNDAIAFCFIFT